MQNFEVGDYVTRPGRPGLWPEGAVGRVGVRAGDDLLWVDVGSVTRLYSRTAASELRHATAKELERCGIVPRKGDWLTHPKRGSTSPTIWDRCSEEWQSLREGGWRLATAEERRAAQAARGLVPVPELTAPRAPATWLCVLCQANPQRDRQRIGCCAPPPRPQATPGWWDPDGLVEETLAQFPGWDVGRNPDDSPVFRRGRVVIGMRRDKQWGDSWLIHAVEPHGGSTVGQRDTLADALRYAERCYPEELL